MAEPRSRQASTRAVVTVVAVAGTLGGALAIAVADGRADSQPSTAAVYLPPLPTLESAKAGPPAAPSRPIPVATTRSSR